uniref:Uncharacterized protein n=1 Tax=Oryza sativa subsp. japonica TaxID=39947 RepID=Q5QL21_ORYSJ|nr:hypothetical protein [Oryza sativa Japonica Group]
MRVRSLLVYSSPSLSRGPLSLSRACSTLSISPAATAPSPPPDPAGREAACSGSTLCVSVDVLSV